MTIDPSLRFQPIVLVEMTVYDPSIPGTRVLYFSDRPFRTGAGDTPASTPYRNRVQNPGTLTIDLIAAWNKGVAAFGIGEVTLVNTDGALDSLKNYTFDGWPCSVFLAYYDYSGGAPLLIKRQIFSGTQENPDIGKRIINVILRSQMYNLDRPAVIEAFAGTGGIEGDSTVRGLKKPVVVGKRRNVPLILVDAANLVYYVCQDLTGGGMLTGSVTPDRVRDAGVELAYLGSGTYTFAAFQATGVAPGSYIIGQIWSGAPPTFALCVKLGSTPAGQVTASTVNTNTPTFKLIDVIDALLTKAGQGSVVISDVSYPVAVPHTFASVIKGDYGAYIADDSTYAQVLAELAGSVAGWLWYNNSSGSGLFPGWVLQNLPDFDDLGVALVKVSDSDIIDMVKIGNPHTPGEGIPPWSLNYEYDRAELVQTSGLAGSSSVDWRNFVGQQYRTRNRKDASVLTRYPLAQEITQTGRGLLASSPDTPSSDMLTGYWNALQLGYDYYQLTVKLSARLLTPTQGVSPTDSWIPAAMPWVMDARLGVRTSRFGFRNVGNGTLVAPMAVSLDLKARRVTYVVRTTYRDG